jgi:hypothetical protein
MDIHMAQVDTATKKEEVISKAPQKNLRGFTFSTQEESSEKSAGLYFFNSGGELKLMRHVKHLE